MKNTKNKTKYFAYVRKSTEGEERQALSIASQIDKAKELFGSLEIVEVLEEKHSAFKPYNRPVFEDMIKRINSGEANGIIAWHPDRLSRNEIDASTITYLVRTEVIADLKFGSYNFDNSPEGIMMLQMSLSQSQYYSSKLGKDVRRGLENKFNMGWHPNMCPNGYVNVKKPENNYSTIEVDKKRFELIRKAFDLYLSGSYSVPEVLDILNDKLGFTAKTTGKKLTRYSLYRILTNIFYAGIIEYGGKQKKGKHKAMITLEEYDQIQMLLGRHGKPRRRKNNFAYTGIIRCQVCGSLVSADKKRKINKTTGKVKEYTYYRCSHRKTDLKCVEQAVEVKTLENQIDDELSEYELDEDFKELFFRIAKEDKKDNPKMEENIITNLEKQIEDLKIEKSNLVKLSCKGLISDDEFTKQRNDYEKEIALRIENLKKAKQKKNKNDEVIKKVDFATRARINFEKGDDKDRKKILLDTSSNRELKSRKLLITPYNWLIPIREDLKACEAKFARFELGKKPLNKKQNEAFASLCCELRREWDSNPR